MDQCLACFDEGVPRSPFGLMQLNDSVDASSLPMPITDPTTPINLLPVFTYLDARVQVVALHHAERVGVGRGRHLGLLRLMLSLFKQLYLPTVNSAVGPPCPLSLRDVHNRGPARCVCRVNRTMGLDWKCGGGVIFGGCAKTCRDRIC